MFRHLILGLMRDGQPRHGYGLMTEYRGRAGGRISIGNLYRELGRLASASLVRSGVNPPEADPRRIPYQITERGCQLFDQWLVSPLTQDGELSERLLFVDQIPGDALGRLLDRWQEELWLRGKAITRAREDALANHSGDGTPTRYNSLPVLLSRQLKHVSAELEFLKEFRLEFDAWVEQQRSDPGGRRAAPAGPARGGSKRSKGSEL
jgi:DNA-binding PadR family transcriptional regulator